MSRGPGRLQRDIIDILTRGVEPDDRLRRSIDPGGPARTSDIERVLWLCYDWPGEHWFERQVRRALVGLERTGIITSELVRNDAPTFPYATMRLWCIAGTP